MSIPCQIFSAFPEPFAEQYNTFDYQSNSDQLSHELIDGNSSIKGSSNRLIMINSTTVHCEFGHNCAPWGRGGGGGGRTDEERGVSEGGGGTPI